MTCTQKRGDAPSIVIIGAGFSSVCTAIKLLEAGIDTFSIFEKGDRVGGVWCTNTYPGAGCDVQSHLYSYSFAPTYDWTRKYATQHEIRAYVEQCAERYGVLPRIRFKTAVLSATFDRIAGDWAVHTSDGSLHRARILIGATGQLGRPAFPAIPGLDGFHGRLFHSAQWPHDYELTARTVAVIGTGASAIQFVPEIAPKVKTLHLFQRSAPWVLRKRDRVYTAPERWLFRTVRPWTRLYRGYLYCRNESRALAFANAFGLKRLLKGSEWSVRARIRRHIKDRTLRATLTPGYPLGCKRVLLSDAWYPALARKNVNVVTAHIARVDENTIVDRDGVRRAVDTIILGTGFDPTGYQVSMTGLDGRNLGETWRRDGAEAYKGISVAGFPNLFLLYGPNTGLGHQSIVYMIESQVAYVMRCIRLLRDRRLHYIDVRADRQRAYNDRLQQRFQHTIWSDGCASWYKLPTGKITHLWPGFTFDYRHSTGTLDLADYHLIPQSSPGSQGKALNDRIRTDR